MIRVRKIFYEDASYYKLHFKYDQYIIDRLGRIEGAVWSPAKKGWLVPATPEAWCEFKGLFEEEEYQFERAFLSPRLSGYKSKISVSPMPIDPNRLIVRMRKYNQQQLDDIRSIDGRKYHKDRKYWSVPNTDEVIAQLQRLFGDKLEMSV